MGNKTSKNTMERLFFWSPRVLGILAIFFMVMFSLDCFGDGQTTGTQLLCFLMHNLPALVILAILFIAWKWEIIGGILFLAATLGGLIFFNAFTGNWGAAIVMAPFAVTGILFILHHQKYRQVGR